MHDVLIAPCRICLASDDLLYIHLLYPVPEKKHHCALLHEGKQKKVPTIPRPVKNTALLVHTQEKLPKMDLD